MKYKTEKKWEDRMKKSEREKETRQNGIEKM